MKRIPQNIKIMHAIFELQRRGFQFHVPVGDDESSDTRKLEAHEVYPYYELRRLGCSAARALAANDRCQAMLQGRSTRVRRQDPPGGDTR